MWSLKMRVPYIFDKFVEYNMSEIKDKISNYDEIEKNKKEGYLPYLNGTIVTQIYAPSYSAETRLIGKVSKNEKYKFNLWNNKKYESNCLYFNEVDRYNEFIYKNSDKVIEHLIGYTNNYDNVGEYYIVNKYLKIFGSDNSFENTIKTMYFFNDKINELTNRKLYTCIHMTVSNVIKEIKSNGKNIDDIDKIIKDYKEYYKNYKIHIEKQKNILENTKKYNPILKQEEYQEQIDDIENILKYIDNMENNFGSTDYALE
jgi:hypothetical protein